MNEKNRHVIDCLCPCSKVFKINSKYLLSQVKIRKEDLMPRLERMGILLNLPVFFIPDAIYTKNRTYSENQCLLDFYFPYEWLFFENEKQIKFASNDCIEKSGDSFSPCVFFPNNIDILSQSNYKTDEDSFKRIEENGHYTVSYPVKIADTKIGVLGLGPFMNQTESFRQANWDKVIYRIERALQSTADQLQEVFWRRAGDCLTEHCFSFLQVIAKKYHLNEINSTQKEGDLTHELIEGLAALTRQSFLMEGSIVFNWQPEESSFCLFTEVGPGCNDPAWKIHKRLPGEASESLASTANEKEDIVIWRDIDVNPCVHDKARKAYDKEHKKHPLHLSFAIPMRIEEPALGLTIICYNPLGLDGNGISDMENLRRFSEDYAKNILSHTPPAIGRNRFEWLVINELKRLFIALYRERRGWYFRDLVTQGSTVTSFNELKKYFENMLTMQANALSVKITEIYYSDKSQTLEIGKPVQIEFSKDPIKRWFLRTELSSATGNVQYHCDITWDNLLKKEEVDILKTQARMMSLLAHGGT